MKNFIDNIVTGFKIGRARGKVMCQINLYSDFDREYMQHQRGEAIGQVKMDRLRKGLLNHYCKKFESRIKNIKKPIGRIQEIAVMMGYCFTQKHYGENLPWEGRDIFVNNPPKPI